MADGSYSPIQDIRNGAYVMADDPYDKMPPKPALVRAQMETHNTTLLDVHYVENSAIRCTVDHPFWVVDRGWVIAGDLQVGDRLLTPGSGVHTVRNVLERSGSFTTYNLDVEGSDTFFVTSRVDVGPVLVHNLEGEESMYGFLPASGQVGRSPKMQIWSGQWEYDINGNIKWGDNPVHHFFFDAAVKAVCSDIDELPMTWNYERHYKNGWKAGTVFPGIELTYDQHWAAHKAGDDWLMANGFKRNSQMRRDDWLDLYSKGLLDKVAEAMMNGANSRGANVTPDKLARLKNASLGRMAQFLRLKGCGGL